jgi:hypothetical protein
VSTKSGEHHAALGDYVDGICSALGLEVRSSSPRGDSAFVQGLARAAVSVALTTDTRGLLGLLREVELGPRRAWFRSLSITRRGAIDGGSSDVLEVAFTIETIVQREDTP